MAAWRDDKRQEHRLQEEQSTTGLQRTGREVEKKETGKGVMSITFPKAPGDDI